ncbi:MAG TPA: hypothetical protein DIW31_05105 [Bacteroidales bacterium]|nr:hypothetical protein [Bacteroidales bacterium]
MSKKKVFKRVGIALAILLFLLITAISIAIWFVFTPERLTPFVRKQAAKYITCKSEIGEVELTFFSTFPRFGLKVTDFTLINPIAGAQSDTLVNTQNLIGIVDVGAWWKRDELVITNLQLSNGVINAFVDSLGNTNFNITPPDTIPVQPDTTQSEMPFRFIDIKNVELNNISLSYIDNTQKMLADIKDLAVKFNGKLVSDTLNMHLNVNDCVMSFSYNGEAYLKNTSIKLNSQAKVIISKMFVEFGESEASINDISLAFRGTVENDAVNNRINTNITYKSNTFPIPSALALIPPSFQSYIEGVDLKGIASSDGRVSGFYSDSVMPLMDLHIIMNEGELKYAGFPLPLSNMKGDFVFYSDLTHDDITYFRINQFSANTPQSSFGTSGIVNHLFSDIYCDLTSNANLKLSEFAPMIPSDLKMKVNGNVKGQVRTAFFMSQMEKMLLDKMRFSGSVTLSNFDVIYDSIYMKTDYSTVDFSMPNANTSNKISRFLSSKINSKTLEAGTINGYRAFLKNALVNLETSNVMDTTKLPDVTCSFSLDSLAASMDTMKVDLFKPSGNLTMYSLKGSNKQDRILLNYSNDKMEASMGSNMLVKMNKAKLNADVTNFMASPNIKIDYAGSNLAMQMDTNIIKMDEGRVSADVVDYDTKPKIKFAYAGSNLDMQIGQSNSVKVSKIKMNSDIANDPTQKDIFLQWMVKGFLDMENGVISSSMLNESIEIPSVKMDFDPQVFNIKESKLKIDKSDFSLAGTLSNIQSFIKKDSLLRGNFSFISNQTDVLKLMNLTSGLGGEPSDSISQTASDTTLSSAYMVPKGIDFILHTSVKKVLFGNEIAKDITGDVRVKDGILVLDDLLFTTPASKMQLTLMYKTPRKNHIYAGFDYHMFDIEIDKLIKMMPIIDSIMPMLKSFKGTAEFHIAAETYLDSMYNPKKSTIRGASSIKGHNLVVMDGQTFSEIAKTMKFTKKAENKVDSISAEFTVFKNEIDIYPFMVVLDKYKVVIAGRHNMDMSFDYNISLLESPIPFRICVEAKGTMDNLKIRPIKCKYRDLNRPSSRMVLQNKQLELRKLIRESLLKNVKK